MTLVKQLTFVTSIIFAFSFPVAPPITWQDRFIVFLAIAFFFLIIYIANRYGFEKGIAVTAVILATLALLNLVLIDTQYDVPPNLVLLVP